MDRGRPSRNEQAQMQEKLRKYFEYGISAKLAAEKAGVDKNTACRYYNLWADQLTEQQNVDYLKRQKEERERIIISFEREILQLVDSLDDVEEEIKKYKDANEIVPKFLFYHKLEIHKFIASLIEKKGSFVMQPPIGFTLKQKIREIVDDDTRAVN